MARAELAQRCPRPLARAMAGAELARRAMAGNFLAQHTVAAVQSEKLSESDVDRAKAERRRSPRQACVRVGVVALREEPRASVMPLNTFLQRRVVGRPALVVVLWYRYLSNDALASSWRGTPAPHSTSSSSSCSRTTGQCRRRSLTLKFSNTRRARAERSAQDLHKVSSLLCFVSKVCCSFSICHWTIKINSFFWFFRF